MDGQLRLDIIPDTRQNLTFKLKWSWINLWWVMPSWPTEKLVWTERSQNVLGDCKSLSLNSSCSWLVNKPVIRHVSGEDGIDSSGDTYSRCLYIMRECIKERDQPIHLHCFGGFPDQVRQWRQVFPNTHFGFAGNVRYYSQEQKEGILEVPDHRALVETDSPYMPLNSTVTHQSPQYVDDVAALVADIRRQSTKRPLQPKLQEALFVNRLTLCFP